MLPAFAYRCVMPEISTLHPLTQSAEFSAIRCGCVLRIGSKEGAMRYKQEILINRPVDEVVEHFDSSENMMKWFPDLKSFEHLSGEPGQPGAKSKLVFETKRGNFEMIETITVRNLPDEFSGTYDTLNMGIFNTMTIRLVPVDEGSTRYESEIDYTFSGFKWKVMSLFMRPMFKRESFKVMKLFKEFAESQPEKPDTLDQADSPATT